MEKQTKWIDVWTQNYTGQSEAAKSIMVKSNYKASKYIPWAVMERVLYQLDDNADVAPILTDTNSMVWTDTFALPIVSKEGTESYTLSVSHFVKVKCDFMGKVFYELFPLQDNSYAAVRIYDQNLVNKAIQRAKAKVISRATGIGWGLYENGDLQYELDGEAPIAYTPTPKPDPKKEVKKVEAPKVEEQKEGYADQIKTLLTSADPAKVEQVLAFVNKSLKRTYDKELSANQSLEEIDEIVQLLAKPDVLINSIKTQLGAD